MREEKTATLHFHEEDMMYAPIHTMAQTTYRQFEKKFFVFFKAAILFVAQ